MLFVCGFASVFSPTTMFEKRSASLDEECCMVLSEMMASCFGSLPECRLMAAVGLGAVTFEDAVKAMEDRDAGRGA